MIFLQIDFQTKMGTFTQPVKDKCYLLLILDTYLIILGQYECDSCANMHPV